MSSIVLLVLALVLGPPVPADEASGASTTEEPPTDPKLEEQPAELPRALVVDASVLGDGTAFDAFTFAGSRTIIGEQQMVGRGASSVVDALRIRPRVRVLEGGIGEGSQDTVLQVGVRGVNPQLSSRATILLDEIPVASAPYGLPQLRLFPISLFSVEDIDVVRGGATARYGPQTSGGVINLRTKPIPRHPSVRVFAQGLHNRDLLFGSSYGATHGRFGMYLAYSPRVGRSWREHSDMRIHAGLAKFAWQFNRRVRLVSISHGYFEDSELPGGLRRDSFDVDPFQSQRPFDFFRGMRGGTALVLDANIRDRHALDVSAWYNRSYHSATIADLPGDDRNQVGAIRARSYEFDVLGLAPRWSVRHDSDRFDVSSQLSAGARVAYELASLGAIVEEFGSTLTVGDDDARAGAYAAYLDEKLILLGGDLTIDAGLRVEYIQMSRRSISEAIALFRSYWAPLPVLSLWYAPVNQLALHSTYSRSFGPPTYMQMSATAFAEDLAPEVHHSVELGAKAFDLGGVHGELTGWYKGIDNFTDVNIEAFDAFPSAHHYGVEAELSWYPGDVWGAVGDLEIYASYTWTRSYLVGLTYTSNRMPLYPEHQAWAGLSYAFEFGLKLGLDISHTGAYFSDYENREFEGQDASTGLVPAYTLVHPWLGVRAPLPTGWRLEFAGGVKNVGDVRYFSRTDDRNAGLLVGRPRTFYLSVSIVHDFLPADQRAPGRARGPRTKRIAPPAAAHR